MIRPDYGSWVLTSSGPRHDRRMFRCRSASPGQAAEVAVHYAVCEGPADGFAGDQDAVVDRPDQPVHVGGHVGAGRELAAGDRAVQRQAVAVALRALETRAEDPGERGIVLGLPDQGAADRAGVRAGEEVS